MGNNRRRNEYHGSWWKLDNQLAFPKNNMSSSFWIKITQGSNSTVAKLEGWLGHCSWFKVVCRGCYDYVTASVTPYVCYDSVTTLVTSYVIVFVIRLIVCIMVRLTS